MLAKSSSAEPSLASSRPSKSSSRSSKAPLEAGGWPWLPEAGSVLEPKMSSAFEVWEMLLLLLVIVAGEEDSSALRYWSQ